jgi:hypothetical protein
LSNVFLTIELLLLASYPSFWKFIIQRRQPLIYFLNFIVTLLHLLFFLLWSVNVVSLQFVLGFHFFNKKFVVSLSRLIPFEFILALKFLYKHSHCTVFLCNTFCWIIKRFYLSRI